MNLNDILRRLRIDELNMMQEECFAASRKNPNIILLSPTGSGKTLAYLLPLVADINVQNDDVQAMVIVPSRELARQTQSVLQIIGEGVRSIAVYGGRAAMDEHRSIKNILPHVIIGTPGRLNDHISKCNISTASITKLVIDEFDKCLELGFQDEMQEVVRQLPSINRRMLLSATDCLEIPQFIETNESCKRLSYLDEEEQITSRIDVNIVHSPQKDKLETLGKLLTDLSQQSSIIFVGYRESVERVNKYLKQQGFYSTDFHGGMEQDLRERAIFRFSNGACNIMVCTDLASRGLDIPNVDNIIHYHLPVDEQSYIHRNGRTARWDAQGRAFLILGPEEYKPQFIIDELVEYRILSDTICPATPLWESMYIGRGKKDKLSKVDIVGFMMKIGGLEKDEVGRIEVRAHCSYVSIKRTRLRELMLRIKGQKIKGMKTIIEPTK